MEVHLLSLRSHCSVFKVQFLQKLVFPSFQWCSAENGGLKLESYNTFVAYMPLRVMNRCLIPLPFSFEKVVGSNGLEPSTSRLSGARSNHLSYEPMLVEMRRIELLTPCLQSRCAPSCATPPQFGMVTSSLYLKA